MKRILSGLAAMLLLFAAAGAAAEGGLVEEEFIMEDLPADIDLLWEFPVALSDMDPAFIVLANKQYLLTKNFVPEPLVKIPARKSAKDGSNSNGGMLKASSGTMQLQKTCAEALVAMSEAAREDGIYLYLKSAYRSWSTQNTMYQNRLKKNKGKDDGWVSKAGASDHQTGLGADVIPKSWINKSGMNSKMAKEKECVWMAEHCQEYGFILRYPEDKQEITEIHFEPWHMRYVGIPAATYIMENGLCLEEFTDQLQSAIRDYLARGGDPEKVQAYIQNPAEQ